MLFNVKKYLLYLMLWETEEETITTGITTDLLEVFNLTYDPAAERLCWVGDETGLLRYYERK